MTRSSAKDIRGVSDSVGESRGGVSDSRHHVVRLWQAVVTVNRIRETDAAIALAARTITIVNSSHDSIATSSVWPTAAIAMTMSS